LRRGLATGCKDRRTEAGFTLVEVLVALAVAAVSLVAIAALAATNVRGTRAFEQRLALLAATRAVLTALPDRVQLAPGELSGELADYRWRLDVRPFQASFVDPRRPTPWTPEELVVRVQAPTGEVVQIDSVRLRPRQARK
jgi:general secretion pathway protein I